MNSNHDQTDIQSEQEHVPPQLPEDPEGLEVEKRQMARFIPLVVIVLAVVFVVIALTVS